MSIAMDELLAAGSSNMLSEWPEFTVCVTRLRLLARGVLRGDDASEACLPRADYRHREHFRFGRQCGYNVPLEPLQEGDSSACAVDLIYAQETTAASPRSNHHRSDPLPAFRTKVDNFWPVFRGFYAGVGLSCVQRGK